jgi:hypothetical protein
MEEDGVAELQEFTGAMSENPVQSIMALLEANGLSGADDSTLWVMCKAFRGGHFRAP